MSTVISSPASLGSGGCDTSVQRDVSARWRNTANDMKPGFHDITSGNNGAYSAGPGWDACSGLGSPDGTALLTRL